MLKQATLYIAPTIPLTLGSPILLQGRRVGQIYFWRDTYLLIFNLVAMGDAVTKWFGVKKVF